MRDRVRARPYGPSRPAPIRLVTAPSEGGNPRRGRVACSAMDIDREALHHRAEIALLRDLFAATHPGTR